MNAYCLDTSALLDNPKAMMELGEKTDEVLIPFCVLDELDNKKNEPGQVGKNAREVINTLDALRSQGSLHKGIKLKSDAVLRVVDHEHGHTNDERVINTALAFMPICLVTNDVAMRIKADSMAIDVMGLDPADQFTIYDGTIDVEVTSDTIDEFYEQGFVEIPQYVIDKYDIHPQQMMIMKGQDGQQSALSRIVIDSQTTRWKAVAIKKRETWGVNARNKEQEFALNLLTNPSVHMVSLIGRSGCGKSFLSLAAGVEQVVEQKLYDQLLIIRPVVSVGADLGYLPGSMEEKLAPWLQPIKDNLNVLFAKKKANIEMLFENGTFQMEALSYIRGRSIQRSFIIVDECQNMSLNELKTVLTRAADGSKIVLTGDIEQIDKHNLDVVSNGLSLVIEKLKKYTITGHMTLTKGQRSPLATVCSEVL